jgi:hypothetical protein
MENSSATGEPKIEFSGAAADLYFCHPSKFIKRLVDLEG